MSSTHHATVRFPSRRVVGLTLLLKLCTESNSSGPSCFSIYPRWEVPAEWLQDGRVKISNLDMYILNFRVLTSLYGYASKTISVTGRGGL
jgi:hypothetical protein